MFENVSDEFDDLELTDDDFTPENDDFELEDDFEEEIIAPIRNKKEIQKSNNELDFTNETNSILDKLVEYVRPSIVGAVNRSANKGADKVKSWLD